MSDNQKNTSELNPIKLGEMFQSVKDTRDDVKEIKDMLKTQNSRVRKLENWRSYMLGIIALGVFLIKFVII